MWALLPVLPVHLAARRGATDVVDFLLSQAPDTKDAKGTQGRTPLMEACDGSHHDCTLYLLEQTSVDDLAEEDENHENVACIVSRSFRQDCEILVELVRRGAPLIGKSFQVCVDGWRVVQFQLERGAQDVVIPRHGPPFLIAVPCLFPHSLATPWW